MGFHYDGRESYNKLVRMRWLMEYILVKSLYFPHKSKGAKVSQREAGLKMGSGMATKGPEKALEPVQYLYEAGNLCLRFPLE